MTDIDLDALAALAETATPDGVVELVAYGTWVCANIGKHTCAAPVEYGHEPGCGLEPLVDVGNTDVAAYIAAACNAAPALIRRVREAEADVRNYRDNNGWTERDMQRARADAAEARVAELEDQANAAEEHSSKDMAARIDAEAERDRLRDGITALADECDGGGSWVAPGMAARLRALCSPTADTEGSNE